MGVDKEQENRLVSKVPEGAIFEHYKGKKYKIITTGRHSETLELCVIYQALYNTPDFGDHSVWIRPLGMFLETVIIDGEEKPKFRLISGDSL